MHIRTRVAFLLILVLPLLPGKSLSNPFEVQVVVRHLDIPWALDFAPDGRLYFTERPGRIKVLERGGSKPMLLGTLSVAHEGEGGLLGLALDANFSQNGVLFVYYTYRDGNGLWNRVVRLTEKEGRIVSEKTLLDRIPGASIHDGGRIKIGPDGRLYITTGDAANRANLDPNPCSSVHCRWPTRGKEDSWALRWTRTSPKTVSCSFTTPTEMGMDSGTGWSG